MVCPAGYLGEGFMIKYNEMELVYSSVVDDEEIIS
jgi:hypothetical protein